MNPPSQSCTNSSNVPLFSIDRHRPTARKLYDHPPSIDTTMRYWMNAITHNHVLKYIEGKFIQSGHGTSPKRICLQNLSPGDKMIFYSHYANDLPRAPQLRKFTAMGTVPNSNIYQIEISSQLKYFRRDMEFVKDVKAIWLHEVFRDLDFIEGKSTQHWESAFRRGLFEISENDYGIIELAMKEKTKDKRDPRPKTDLSSKQKQWLSVRSQQPEIEGNERNIASN